MVRGRGYSSRGGGRGNSYRSSGTSYRGGSRKDFNETGYRGGTSRYNSGSYNSYESRSRDKFASRYENRHEGKRSYRENSRDRSDDRKRPRQEDSRLNSSYGSASSYRNRNDSSRNRASSPSGGYQGRGSSSAYRRGTREGSAGRRHGATDSMGPPKRPIRSSYVVRPRGSASRVRGAGASRGGMRVVRKESSDMRVMRRQLLLARQRDRARLIKIARLTSSLRKRKGPRSSESPSGRSKSRGGDKKSDNEEEEEDEEMLDEDAVDGEEDADGESGKPKEKRVKKKSKSSSSAKKESAEGDDGVDDDEDADKNGEEETSDKDEDNELDNSIKKDADAMDEDAAEGEDGDEAKEGKNKSTSKDADGTEESGKDKEKSNKERKDERSKEGRRKRSRSPPKRSRFIKLTCVHCRMNCITFKEYQNHLYSRSHKMSMRRVAIRQRVTLARMRTQQRNAQRAIEEKSKDDAEEVKPQFCLLCRLNYRQPKAKHQLSEHHKDMKKFLMPYCQTCHLAFKSPMLYEAHRCSLEHLKRKHRNNDNHSEASDGEREVDLKNFMTVDSVGEIDDLDVEDLEKQLDFDPSTPSKEKVPVGSQFIKKVEAFYCELCRTYNGVKEDEESYIKQHCSSRSHLKAFLRHREDENLQAKAERAEKKDKSKPETAEVTEPEKKDEADEVADEAEVEETEVEEVVEDKLWEDVDKDLGDLLREVGPEEHDEEEEEEEDESVLNIDIESEKSKPSKELNGKKEEPTPPAPLAPVVEEEKPKKDPPSTPVVKLKKEKIDVKPSPAVKAGPASSKTNSTPRAGPASSKGTAKSTTAAKDKKTEVVVE